MALWEQIAAIIQQQVSPDTFQRWFAAVQLVECNEGQIVLQVPNNIYQLWIETNYLPLLHSAILSVLGFLPDLSFTFVKTVKGEEKEITPNLKMDPPAEGLEGRGPRVGSTAKVLTEFASGKGPDAQTGIGATGLNPRYTFDTFVVGQNNQFAQAASRAVAEAPAKTYNPLFIYGGVGLGKTHLMQAIGQMVLSKKKGHKVIYISSEKFTNEFIDAIQHSTLVKFRKRYRLADILLIDDIQFLAGKERSQEEFFHTFNALFDGHKQIILSSDRPPSEIANLEQRLVSRFEWGLTAELQPPDIETRLAILRKKANSLQVSLSASVMDFLAERIRTNVRRLEGALMRVASYASLSGQDLTQEAIENLLKDVLQEEAKRTITIEQIQRAVAEHYDVRLADMSSKRRPASIAFPRQIAMYLSRELTRASLNEIGDAFGGRDHGTVLHAHRLIKKRMKTEDSTRQVISLLDSQLQR